MSHCHCMCLARMMHSVHKNVSRHAGLVSAQQPPSNCCKARSSCTAASTAQFAAVFTHAAQSSATDAEIVQMQV